MNGIFLVGIKSSISLILIAFTSQVIKACSKYEINIDTNIKSSCLSNRP